MSKIGFIGAGNMAGALVKGIISSKVFPAGDVLVYDIVQKRQDELEKQFGVKAAESSTGLVESADIVVLSVKPQNFTEVLECIKGYVGKEKLVISIAAGITTSKIAKFLPEASIIRVMPNTPALVSEGATAIYSRNAEKNAVDNVVKIFAAVGKAVVVEKEELIDAVTAVSGSGPAYFFLLMEEMIKAGVKLGLSEDVARELVLQTAKGAAILAGKADENKEGPAELRKKVTSPGGTTEAALEVFAEGQFNELVSNALKAACDRSKELPG
ncbi:MAG: pyrroline-5-carboxylate reductase [Sedimentisphaerales bacterium]|nr:pyrroline-5-carboxylate reductase [Sedimentisphaerales bacterium]